MGTVESEEETEMLPVVEMSGREAKAAATEPSAV